MKLPNKVDILWQRAAVAAAQTPAAEPLATAETVGSTIADMPYEMMQMMMPHSRPTLYEALDESLEALLNSGWSITQATGAGAGMALVLKRGQQHAICMLIGNMRDTKTGRSDCRRIN